MSHGSNLAIAVAKTIAAIVIGSGSMVVVKGKMTTVDGQIFKYRRENLC